MDKPKVITMCGSSRFIDKMAVKAWELERDDGAIVMGLHLLPKWYTHIPGHLAEVQGVAPQMDELHKRKIDISDEIFVFNFDGYVGESTQGEIEYAQKHGKPIRWLEADNIPLFGT